MARVQTGWPLALGLAAALIAAAPAHASDQSAAATPQPDLDAAMGKALFERAWLPAPSSTDAADGLGPLFSGRACAACHRGGGPAQVIRVADGTVTLRGIVLRFGTTAGAPDPFYGYQLQEQAVPGLQAEGRLMLAAKNQHGDAATPITWAFELTGPPLTNGVHTGVRLAPSLVGRADLERIDAAAILAAADADDRNGDGISGRARLLGSVNGRPVVGRFGWKAAAADLRDQVAGAFALDMGLASRDAPFPYGDCTPLQLECRGAPNGVRHGASGQELDDTIISLVASFVRSRPAPAHAGVQAQMHASAALRLLTRAGCIACHTPTLPDAAGRPVTAFTDLLLHDMGGDLDDGVGEPGVASAEWRTAPLVDLAPRGGTRRYLHDGRAASIAQAIAAHGGEATTSRTRYAALSAADRAALSGFLEGF